MAPSNATEQCLQDPTLRADKTVSATDIPKQSKAAGQHMQMANGSGHDLPLNNSANTDSRGMLNQPQPTPEATVPAKAKRPPPARWDHTWAEL